jgi:hypothetical protein
VGYGATKLRIPSPPFALRLVLDAADEVYTVVDGKRVNMTSGDVVLTNSPSGAWRECRLLSQALMVERRSALGRLPHAE